MPSVPVRPANHVIEPELRVPLPRTVRLRAAMVKWRFVEWGLVGLSVAGLLMFEPVSDFLIACFGRTVPAEVTYTLDRREFSRSTPGRTLLAHLDYEWRGARHHDTRRVPSDLLERFRSHRSIPVKVLRPWQALPWPQGVGGSPWRQLLLIDSPLAGLIIAGIGGFVWLGVGVRRAHRRLVREGSAVVGAGGALRKFLAPTDPWLITRKRNRARLL